MLKFVDIGGVRYRWKDVLRMRKEQDKAAKQPQQETLFALKDDSRPAVTSTAERRYAEPTLFKVD
jgi:hypothetical protein